MTVAMVLIALVGPYLIPYGPEDVNISNKLAPPSAEHPLGTDDFGRDILSRVVVGSRISMRVGAGVMLLSVIAGTILGLLSGYFPALDGPIMRVMDALMAFPALILALAAVAVLGQHEINTIIALGIVYTPPTARIVRSSVLTIREWTFVEAARAVGADHWRIVRVHLLPNCMAPLLVQGTFVFAMAIIGEAALSFLGAGPPPPAPTWGNMISDARLFLRQAPWFSMFPGLAIFLSVVGLNLLGDGLRDILDPQVQQYV